MRERPRLGGAAMLCGLRRGGRGRRPGGAALVPLLRQRVARRAQARLVGRGGRGRVRRGGLRAPLRRLRLLQQARLRRRSAQKHTYYASICLDKSVEAACSTVSSPLV
jgi:hypothetical protein